MHFTSKMVTAAIGCLLMQAVLLDSTVSHASVAYSEELVGNTPNGNHQLDCTVIRPWETEHGKQGPYPVIGWANGWGGGEIKSADETAGYKPGLIKWAVDGPFIVIAANQWSARERDLLQCVSWLVAQNANEESEYYGMIQTDKIGLAGHSQGGGAALRSGDGAPQGVGLGLDLQISTAIAMNPYGPAWHDVPQHGPALLIGGDLDTTTPPESYEQAWQQIKYNGKGGINASLSDGTHNRDAWAPADDYNNPHKYDFGRYQNLTRLWWQMQLYGVNLKNEITAELAKDQVGAYWSVDVSNEFQWIFKQQHRTVD